MRILVLSENLRGWLTIFHLPLFDCDIDSKLLICNFRIHDCTSDARLQYRN